MPTQAERTEATRAALVGAGQRLFGDRGYGAVGTGEIVAAAGVTRGALYHHFRDKRDLFRAVVVATEQAFVMRVGERVLSVSDTYEQLVVAMDATLDACTDRELARIAFLDGPAVLGFEEWHAIVEEYTLGVLVAMLEQAMTAGALRAAPAGPLAHVVLGALNEAGMAIATGGDREALGAAMRALLEGLRA